MNPLIPALVGGMLGAVQDAPPPAPPVWQLAPRPLPAGTVKAVMAPPVQGLVRFGDKTLFLAPGLQIRDAENRIVMPMSLREPATVRYLLDAGGKVSRVWILTPAEAEQPE